VSGERDPDSGETLPGGASSPFPDPTETALDYDAQALARVALQYRQSPRFLATVSMLVGPFQALEDCLVSIPPLDDPVVATGVNLDVTGELVGQGRVLSDGTVSSDLFYSSLIASRIARNKAIASGAEFSAAIAALIFPGPFRFYDLGHMTVGIEVAGEPNPDQQALLDDGPMPRAMAVGVIRLWYTDGGFFGFQGDTRPGLDGFGLQSNLSLGGRLGMLF
jgi:hypothetical protein